MSTVVLEPIVEKTVSSQPAGVDLVAGIQATESQREDLTDPHPLLPVFVAGAVSLIFACAFVGSIVVWLMLRNSGVMAP
jgi:hypothetical protein